MTKKRKQPATATAPSTPAGKGQPPAAPATPDQPWPRAWRRVTLILLLAFALRVTALDWGIPSDRHYAFHPDEMAGCLTIKSLWQDPHHLATTFFASAKGIGFFYVGLAVMMIESKLGFIGPAETAMEDIYDARRVFLSLRGLTVAFSLGTILLVFFVGRRLFGPRVAELAALLEAVSPISVINAHYIKIDCAQSFLVMLVLYFSVRSFGNRRWLIPAVLFSGVAAAFKYPGGSAIIYPLAASVLVDGDRIRRLKLFGLSLPLFVVGFFCCFPSALTLGPRLMDGMGVAAGNAFHGSLSPLLYIAFYPFRLMQAVGVVLPAWALAAVVWAGWRHRREHLLLLAWLVPYYLIMSSSAVVLIRYSVSMMPVLALLMAAFVPAMAARKPEWAKQGVFKAATAAAVVMILTVTLVHLRTMLRPDPRDMAGSWVTENLKPGEAIANTVSHLGDESFIVPVRLDIYNVFTLDLTRSADVNNSLNQSFRYLATNEQAWLFPETRHPSQLQFWRMIWDPQRWEPMARFVNRPSWPGVLLRGTLPEDMYYLYQETRIYRRK